LLCCQRRQEYLEENEQVTFDVFLEKIWDNIREIYRHPQQDEAKDEPKEAEPESVTTETSDVSRHWCLFLVTFAV